MTSDEITMAVSLIDTYCVMVSLQYRMEVLNLEEIVSRFVQAILRDGINKREMSDVMHDREELNLRLLNTLRKIETQDGIQYVTIQL